MDYDMELNKQTAELIRENKLTTLICIECELIYIQEHSDAIFSESYCSRQHEIKALEFYADKASLYAEGEL